MTEYFLHQVWKKKQFPILNLKLTDGRSFQIIKSGEYNSDKSGPDFKYACIEIDGIEIHGHIEIHLKASDWRKHNHHLDKNYDNVILHVVYDYNMNIVQDDVIIPTFELKDFVSQSDYLIFVKHNFKVSDFLCGNSILSIDPMYLEMMKGKALHRKLAEKVNSIESYYWKNNDLDILYYFIATSFGMGINKIGFEQLLGNIPFRQIKKLNSNQLSSLLKCESGIFNKDSFCNDFWNFKGTRPRNFPSNRLEQLSFFSTTFDFDLEWTRLLADDIIESFNKKVECINSQSSWKIGRTLKSNILINGLVPFLWYLGEKNENEDYIEKATNILSNLPPEDNNVIRKWKSLKTPLKNAYDTQSLLALHRYYCCNKKCLSCDLGNKILNRSNDSENYLLL